MIYDRLKHAWNAFMNKDPTGGFREPSIGYSYRIDRPRFSRGNERSIVTAILNRIALDASSVDIIHARLDAEGRFMETIHSTFNDCLNVEANIDQTGRAFIHDIVMTMLDEGCVAIVPTDTNISPLMTGSYNILSLRTGKIIKWFPDKVLVRVYNEKKGRREDVLLLKKFVAIVENPFYATMNEPNSTLSRLMRKLVLLDSVDEQTSAGKLDMIIQLPYTIKTEARKKQAEQRRADIEAQLSGSRYGIAYTDGTEKITQLNRSLENNLLKQIEYLTTLLYSQLGITQEIMNGTATPEAMNNYTTRVIEPILSAISDEMKRKFLTKTARAQGQSIEFFVDPFKLIPVSKMAEIADTFTRNEILSSNEMRQIIGRKPSQNPAADELRNKNLNQTGDMGVAMEPSPNSEMEEGTGAEGESAEQPQTVEDYIAIGKRFLGRED